uniref:FLYWCH-type domain-containing protein n=1 Tax=Ditylenchus dipsaci TaxID=166011 RepID=A0A915D9Y0_9BILA
MENLKAEHNGFLFVKHILSKPNGEKEYWTCDKHLMKDGGCKARLHTVVQGDVFVKLLGHLNKTGGQNHAVNPVAKALAEIKSCVKEKAITSQDNIVLDSRLVCLDAPSLLNNHC